MFETDHECIILRAKFSEFERQNMPLEERSNTLKLVLYCKQQKRLELDHFRLHRLFYTTGNAIFLSQIEWLSMARTFARVNESSQPDFFLTIYIRSLVLISSFLSFIFHLVF